MNVGGAKALAATLGKGRFPPIDVVVGHAVQLRRALSHGATDMQSVLGEPERYLAQQTYECHEMGHSNVKFGHAKDYRQLGMFKTELMDGCRLNVLRVSYNMRTTMEVIIGPVSYTHLTLPTKRIV